MNSLRVGKYRQFWWHWVLYSWEAVIWYWLVCHWMRNHERQLRLIIWNKERPSKEMKKKKRWRMWAMNTNTLILRPISFHSGSIFESFCWVRNQPEYALSWLDEWLYLGERGERCRSWPRKAPFSYLQRPNSQCKCIFPFLFGQI